MNKLWMMLAAFWLSECGNAGGEGGEGSGGEGDGSGGDGSDEGGSGEGEGGDISPWFGKDLDPDLVSVIGDRDLETFIKWGKGQREAAAAREEQIIEKSGLLKPPGEGDEVGEFFRPFRPTAADDYGKTIGLDPEKASRDEKVLMESAFAADIHPDQYKRLVEAQKVAQDTWQQEEAGKIVAQTKEQWGVDAEKNGQAVDRVVKALGLSDGFAAALSNPAMGVGSEDFSKILNGLKDMGLNMREGSGPGGEGEGSGDSQSLTEQRDQLESEVIDGGKPATKDQERRLTELNAAIAKEKSQ